MRHHVGERGSLRLYPTVVGSSAIVSEPAYFKDGYLRTTTDLMGIYRLKTHENLVVMVVVLTIEIAIKRVRIAGIVVYERHSGHVEVGHF